MLSENLIFYICSIALLTCAFTLVIVQNQIFSLVNLVFSFLFASFLLFLLECEFLGYLFLVIYTGAIAILFLFAIMMLEPKLKNLNKDYKNFMKYLPVIFSLSFFLIPLLIKILIYYEQNIYLNSFYLNKYQNWYDLIDSVTDIESYGQILYSYFVFQFLVAGLILLVVLIGVVYLTNNYNNKQNVDQLIFKQLSRDFKFFF